jgi:hypothetical protein
LTENFSFLVYGNFRNDVLKSLLNPKFPFWKKKRMIEMSLQRFFCCLFLCLQIACCCFEGWLSNIGLVVYKTMINVKNSEKSDIQRESKTSMSFYTEIRCSEKIRCMHSDHVQTWNKEYNVIICPSLPTEVQISSMVSTSFAPHCLIKSTRVFCKLAWFYIWELLDGCV